MERLEISFPSVYARGWNAAYRTLCARARCSRLSIIWPFSSAVLCVSVICVYIMAFAAFVFSLSSFLSPLGVYLFLVYVSSRVAEKGGTGKKFIEEKSCTYLYAAALAHTHTHTHRAHHNGYSLRTVKIIYSAGEGRGQQEEFLLRPFVYIYVRARLPGYERCELASCTRREFYDALFRARRGNESQIC